MTRYGALQTPATGKARRAMHGRWAVPVVCGVLGLCALCTTALAADEAARLHEALAACPFKIVYESYRDNNWELMIVDADGSTPVNITQTPAIDELYPHASPDGSKVVFLADEGEGAARLRNVCFMDLDGTGRTIVGENGRQPFWSPDGKAIAYAREPGVKYPSDPYSNSGLYLYDVETGETTPHPNPDLAGLLNPCLSPDGNWIIASAIRAMGYNESIVAVEANGPKIIELMRSCSDAEDVHQCRPDIGPDGRQVAWGTGNTRHKDYMWVEIADVDFDLDEPKVTSRRRVVRVDYPLQTYHVDWSPDGKYIVYAQGDEGTRMQPAGYVIGKKAKGWDLWVVDPSVPNVTVQITHDGLSNKEPDWIFVE